MKMKRSNIICGIVLIVLGVIFALNVFGITDVSLFFAGWWTMFIIVPCAVGIFTNSDKTGNVIGLFIGIVLFLSCRGIFNFEFVWKLAAPAAIVMIGINLIIKGIRGNRAVMRITDGKPLRQCYAAFSGQNIDYTNELFDGAELTAVFGGIKCDLRNAVFENDAVINVCAVFGGIDILGPYNVNIKTNSTSVFGGISNGKHKNNSGNTVTLYVNGTCTFGGVDIK